MNISEYKDSLHKFGDSKQYYLCTRDYSIIVIKRKCSRFVHQNMCIASNQFASRNSVSSFMVNMNQIKFIHLKI